MKILSIETSCDETGISILEHTSGGVITLLGNALSSQIEIHAQYGGVFPSLAKRAHAEKMVPLLTQALDEAYLLDATEEPLDMADALQFLDEKNTDLKEYLLPFLTFYQKPDIDYIAVTVGPGLEPALWVGVVTARALASVWNIPVIPINHMEGHIITAAFTLEQNTPVLKMNDPTKRYVLSDIQFPLLSLLVSGGHTELVLAEAFGTYTKIGQTRDDAVGEAFDKVARMLGLAYPGGPAVSKLAKEFRFTHSEAKPRYVNPFAMPRPMIHSGDYDFSFSGIKTAMLYMIRDLTDQNKRELTDEEKQALACAFEDAAIEVLIKKTLTAVEEYGIQTLIVGGGVAGNTYLRSELAKALLARTVLASVTLLFPEPWLATDNAVMIGMAAMAQAISGHIKTSAPEDLRADGNLSL